MKKSRLTFGQFKNDMKIMYSFKGRYMVKEFSKMQLIISISLLLMKKPLELEWLYIGVMGLMPGLILVIAYLSVYFFEYRELFELWREDSRLEMKYPFMYQKFMKTE